MKESALRLKQEETKAAVNAFVVESEKHRYGKIAFADWLGLEDYLNETYVEGKKPSNWKKYMYGAILVIIG